MKKMLSLILALAMCFTMAAPAMAADGHTEVFTCYHDKDKTVVYVTTEIPNVVKTANAVSFGYSVVENPETGDWEEVADDPSGRFGIYLTDTAGIPVYYVSGDSATIKYPYGFVKLELAESGSFPFDKDIANPYCMAEDIHVQGVGYEKYFFAEDANGASEVVKPSEGSESVTLGPGVWEAGGVQNWVPFVIVVGADVSSETTFSDVPADAYYADAVQWAVENGITSGTSENAFSPNSPCTRAQAVTFLWRAAGSPKVSVDAVFSDVPADAYYADAVEWAVANGITQGTGGGKFSPNATCNRAQIVTFMYRAEGSPTVSGSTAFGDVDFGDYFNNAVQWAVQNGITQGMTATAFSPNSNCIRAQIVTFLYRAYA